MKTTIELPDELFRRAKVAAAREHRSFRQLVIEGLELVLGEDQSVVAEEALERLRKGYRLGGKPMKRESNHAR